MVQITGEILGIQDDSMGKEEDGGRRGLRKWRTACVAPGDCGGVVVGKRLPLLPSHAFEWVRDRVRVIAALHHAIKKVE
jgi:hypothetical protein